jgi:hypothetical protein
MKDYCRWTERSDDYDEICGEDADGGEIFMRTSTGSVTTPVCKKAQGCSQRACRSCSPRIQDQVLISAH